VAQDRDCRRTGFMWLRIGTAGGLDSCGSGLGLVTDWIHVAQGRDW
jgi:hypothetical protein